MKIGDTVEKKSGKPFQNKMKRAVVASFEKMVIPLNHTKVGNQTVDAVTLVGCKGLVRKEILKEI